MIGALSYYARPRKGYADAGPVRGDPDAGQDLALAYAAPPMQGPYTALDAARDLGDTGGDNPPAADDRYVPSGLSSGNADMSAPGAGALSGAMPPQAGANKAAQANLAMAIKSQQDQQILAAGGTQTPPVIQAATAPDAGSGDSSSGPPLSGFDPSRQPGATNLPLLAAAGAFLKPTRSGTFSEALGNAFEAAVPVAEQQRQLAENAALRKAQMDNTAALWGQRNQTQNRAIDQRANAATDKAGYYQALAARAQVQADNPKLSTADLQNKTAQALQNQIDPDTGENYTADKALLRASGIAARETTAAAATTRAGAAVTNAESGATRAQTGVTNSQTRQTQVQANIANQQKTLDFKYWKADQDAALAGGKISADEYKSNMTNMNAMIVGGMPAGQAAAKLPATSAAARANTPAQTPINNPRPASAPPRTTPTPAAPAGNYPPLPSNKADVVPGNTYMVNGRPVKIAPDPSQ